ncbi:MAG TPA: 50S ribosomal protein L22 [Verrucomicrobiae bacterium]|nr:50S ribosomal protein L22 [Verrucomicrobiae bacterium]
MAKEAVKTKEVKKDVKAFARYIHVSPRKLRLVADLVRKSKVEDALEQLRYSSKNAALPIAKVINSAIANAVHNFNYKKEDLVVKSITVDGGPVYRRMEPRAQGRGFIVRKRTSHINVVLESRPSQARKNRRSIFSLKPRVQEVETSDKPEKELKAGKQDGGKAKPVTGPKSDQKIKQNLVDLKRRLFNRKSGQ